MKTKALLLVCCLSYLLSASAQSTLEEVVKQIRNNNTSIPVIQKLTQAGQYASATDLYLPDPVVEIAHFNGKPGNIGTRTDFSVRQKFDFPGAYIHRSKLSAITHQYLTSKAAESEQNIVMEAVMLYLQAVELNGLMEISKQKNKLALQITKAMQQSLELGNTGILELNQARMFLMNTKADASLLESELQQKMAALQKLNGGKELVIEGFQYPNLELPVDFAVWYDEVAARIPALNAMKLETEAARKREQLQLALSMPGFEAGYQSEKFMSESFNGFVAGIRIPLMESRNTVKAAKMQRMASEEMQIDLELNHRLTLKSDFEHAAALHRQWQMFAAEAEHTDIRPLLQKSLDSGEINVFSFLFQTIQYYENLVILEQLKGRYFSALAQLYRHNW